MKNRLQGYSGCILKSTQLIQKNLQKNKYRLRFIGIIYTTRKLQIIRQEKKTFF